MNPRGAGRSARPRAAAPMRTGRGAASRPEPGPPRVQDGTEGKSATRQSPKHFGGDPEGPCVAGPRRLPGAVLGEKGGAGSEGHRPAGRGRLRVWERGDVPSRQLETGSWRVRMSRRPSFLRSVPRWPSLLPFFSFLILPVLIFLYSPLKKKSFPGGFIRKKWGILYFIAMARVPGTCPPARTGFYVSSSLACYTWQVTDSGGLRAKGFRGPLKGESGVLGAQFTCGVSVLLYCYVYWRDMGTCSQALSDVLSVLSPLSGNVPPVVARGRSGSSPSRDAGARRGGRRFPRLLGRCHRGQRGLWVRV